MCKELNSQTHKHTHTHAYTHVQTNRQKDRKTMTFKLIWIIWSAQIETLSDRFWLLLKIATSKDKPVDSNYTQSFVMIKDILDINRSRREKKFIQIYHCEPVGLIVRINLMKNSLI